MNKSRNGRCLVINSPNASCFNFDEADPGTYTYQKHVISDSIVQYCITHVYNERILMTFGKLAVDHFFMLTETNKVYTFGSNSHGMCGLGHAEEVKASKPERVLLDDPIVQVQNGMNFSMFLTSDGSLYGAGYAYFGALGPNYANLGYQIATPTKLAINGRVVQFDCGAMHTFALTENGEIWHTGYNSDGQQGVGNNQSVYGPVLLPASDFEYERIVRVACGNLQTCFLSANGNIWVTGSNTEGKCWSEGSALKYEKVTRVTHPLIQNRIKYLQTNVFKNAAIDVDNNLLLSFSLDSTPAPRKYNISTKSVWLNNSHLAVYTGEGSILLSNFFDSNFAQPISLSTKYKDRHGEEIAELLQLKPEILYRYGYGTVSHVIPLSSALVLFIEDDEQVERVFRNMYSKVQLSDVSISFRSTIDQ